MHIEYCAYYYLKTISTISLLKARTTATLPWGWKRDMTNGLGWNIVSSLWTRISVSCMSRGGVYLQVYWLACCARDTQKITLHMCSKLN